MWSDAGADGYHLLQTVFRLLDFSDQLVISLRARRVDQVANAPSRRARGKGFMRARRETAATGERHFAGRGYFPEKAYSDGWRIGRRQFRRGHDIAGAQPFMGAGLEEKSADGAGAQLGRGRARVHFRGECVC